jgi:hypothetical protein
MLGPAESYARKVVVLQQNRVEDRLVSGPSKISSYCELINDNYN